MVASALSSVGVAEHRCALLSSRQHCLGTLRQGDTSWDVLVALCMHIDRSLADLEPSEVDWQAETGEFVFNAVEETEWSRPTFIGERVYREIPFDAELSRHVHSRVAASLLIKDDQPRLALQFLESVNEILPPKTVVHLPRDLSWGFVDRVRRPLQELYEQSGDYELALQLHRLRVTWGNPVEHYAVAEFYLNQWTTGLEGNVTVREAKSLLGATYAFLVDADRVDEEVRDSLADCPRDTRQFWAWLYGKTIGFLKIEHPHLKDALLHELDASGWEEGWPVASILVEDHPGWPAHRKTCMTLYWASDIEYKGARPWNARQPAHLGPSSDLYWAMRVGYCDAHLEAGQAKADISEQLEDLKQVVSSGSLRAIRSQVEVMQGLTSIARAIPTEEAARTSLADHLGHELLALLPTTITEHLIAAWLARLQGRANDARVATVKAIEAVFTRIIKPRLREVSVNARISVTRQNGSNWTLPLEEMGRIQLADWATLLPDLVLGRGANRRLRDALLRAFPSIDWELLGRCEPALRDASRARGQSAHDPDREPYGHAMEEADRLWSIAVGSITTPGLIPRLCEALGVDLPEEK